MRNAVLFCAVLAGLSLARGQTPAPKALSPFERELAASEQQFIQAMRDKNDAYVNRVAGEDFKRISTNGDLTERDELVTAAREGLPKDYRYYDLRVIRLDDDCGMVIYNTIVPGEHPRYRHVSDTWTKEDGQWKLRFEQETPNLWSAADLD
jgi:hypothetical protein